MNSKWPTTVEAAAEIVYKPLSDEFKCDFISAPKDRSLIEFHSTMGRRIRNKFGLWGGNDKLREDAITNHASGDHADNISYAIMGLVYDKCLEYDRKRLKHGSPICKDEGHVYFGEGNKCRYCGNTVANVDLNIAGVNK